MDKIKVSRKKVDYVDLDYQTLGKILKDIKGYIELYGEDALLKRYYEYNEDPYWGIFTMELETDEEYAFRETRLQEQEYWERKRYEQFKYMFDT